MKTLDGGLDEAWRISSPGERVRRLRTAAAAARDALLNTGPARAVQTHKLQAFPYPTLYAFSGGALSPAPFVVMTNRMQVVQFDEDGVKKTLLFNPSDVERDRAAIFYANLQKAMGAMQKPLEALMLPSYGTVPAHLEKLGLEPADVDYIAYDHLHVQDLRRWLGGGEPAFFPNAKLLVTRAEWEQTNDLHPMNRVWYVPHGLDGIDERARVRFIDGSVLLGPGVAILSTPGHTLGNMSLAVVTAKGPFVVSENGVATESYTPLQSRIPGVRAYCERMGYEVSLNGNTREGSLDQYSSMIVEKIVAGPCPADPTYVSFCPSSELTSSMMAPGLSPTFSFTPPDHGTLS
jgi:glyoxylase-like metal-dependent hydrolase (beta-lactamase superfamily II)